MADLALAIAGVVSSGIALTNVISSFCQSAYKAPQEVHEIESDLKLLHSVLLQVEEVFGNPENVCSKRAERDLHSILDRCRQIFSDVQNLLAPYQKSDGTFTAGIGERLKWHFKKEDVRKLSERMEKVKSTLHCMIAIINLGYSLSKQPEGHDVGKPVPPTLGQSLHIASEIVVGQQASLINSQLEGIQHLEASVDDTEHRPASERVSAWLADLTGLPDEEGNDRSTIHCKNSTLTLSPSQRSVTREATSDIEMLLERWTTLSESRSGASPSAVGAARKASRTPNPNDLKQGYIASRRLGDYAFGKTERSRKHPEAGESSSMSLSVRQISPTILKYNDGSSKTISSPTNMLQPILKSPYDADDNDTIRALDRIASGPKVKISERVTKIPDDGDASWIVQSWLAQSETSKSSEEDMGHGFDAQSLFSQASILNSSTSDASSVISSIPYSLDSSDPTRVYKLFRLGNKRFRLKKWFEAAALYRQAYAIKRDGGNQDDQEALEIRFKIGAVFGELNKYQSAERILEGVLIKQKELLGLDHAQTLTTQHYYGRVLLRQSRWQDAYIIYEPLWQLRKEFLNDDSTANLAIRTGHELGQTLNEVGKFNEAAEILQIIHQTAKTTFGKIDKITLSSAVELGKALRCTDRKQDAQVLLDETYKLSQHSCTKNDRLSVKCTHELAMLLCEKHEFEEAERYSRAAWESRTAARGSMDIATLESAECLSKALCGLGRLEEGLELMEEVYHHSIVRLGKEHPRSLIIGRDLGQLLLKRLSDISETDTSSPESLSAAASQLLAEEEQLSRHPRTQQRPGQKGASRRIEWYMTERYPPLKSVLQRSPASESPRREKPEKFNGELSLHPEVLEAAANEDRVLQGLYEAFFSKFSFLHNSSFVSSHGEKLESVGGESASQLAVFEVVAREDPVVQGLAKAFLVLSSVFKAFESRLNTATDSTLDAFQFAESLGPQLLKLIEELEKPGRKTCPERNVIDGVKLTLAKSEKKHASNIYKLVYNGQKSKLGAESETVLQSGHEYARLCIQINSFVEAEAVSREVWVRRQRVLGLSSPDTLESGFQLGQIYFNTGKYDAALSLHESVYTLRRDIFGLRSEHTIRSAEVYGQILMCKKSTNTQIEHGLALLYQTLEIRKDMFGITTDTVMSAFRLATISAISGKFAPSGEMFMWVFEVGVDAISIPGDSYYWHLKLVAGFAAAGMAFLDKNNIKGNQLLDQVAKSTAKLHGVESRETQLIAFIQAFVLFLQRKGRKCKAILRRIFEMRKSSLGSKHPATKAAGIVLAMAVLLECLLSNSRIDRELDEINDWLLDCETGAQEWTFVMRFCGYGAVICTHLGLDSIRKMMLGWLYRTQKRRSGLLSIPTLTTLVLSHGLTLYTIHRRKSKKILPKEGTSRDPRIFARKLWPAAIQATTDLLAGVNQMPFFAETLPRFLENSTTWKSFAPTQFTAHFIYMFAPVYQQMAPSNIGSRIWTIATESSDTLTIGQNDQHKSSAASSIDFADLDGRASEHLSSLGNSLLNLTLTASVSDLGEAQAEIESLQDELVGEFVTEDGIAAAEGNIETLRREMEG
ncbi:hypothetical protein BP6252_13526 [Coleophoma cylindrospora]|uniref:Fungal N-terminal domain-containing protein n=1 Tax=Coleophoma cylindrospora TaxID=1849047 RepID=A0A3D8Q8F1_9HELO|nr:hypothetical protein BP6252_13526 [Coleophoma cylindrospora]